MYISLRRLPNRQQVPLGPNLGSSSSSRHQRGPWAQNNLTGGTSEELDLAEEKVGEGRRNS